MERAPELFEVARILADLRDRLDLSQEDFAPLLGLTQSHYSKVEKARYPIKAKNINKLAVKYPKEAEQLRVLVLRLTGLAAETEPKAGIRSKTIDEGHYPIIGRAACGSFEEIIEAGRRATGEKDTRPAPYPTKAKRAYWVEAWGESMCGPIQTEDGAREIRPGDLLFVEDLPPVNGKPALVERDGELTVKLWRKHKDGSVELLPANPKYKVISLDDAREVRAWRITWHDPKPRQF